MSVVLETRGLAKRFGGVVATSDVTFKLERGARQALIGPNGAGKTTFVNLLTGVLAPSAGQVLLLGEDVTNLKPEARVRRGDNVAGEGVVGSLKRFKDEVREVLAGLECGIGVDGVNGVQPGDIIEVFNTEEVARTL